VSPLPVEGWAHSQVCYQHLIRPVVAFVRDRGPVGVDRVREFISAQAPGDLNFASPFRNRPDAAERALNLLADDIDALVIVDDQVFVPEDVTVVKSNMFGYREVPAAADLDAAREASRRQRTLREWVGKRLFATVWRDGIRSYKPTEIEWMAEQIRRFGYVGPKIVRDAELGTIIDGGLRAAALAALGLPLADHSVEIRFDNDLHRLAYVLAAHTSPVHKKTRVPTSLRAAILTKILPHGAGVLRDRHGKPTEPTDEDWLAITGSDFGEPTPAPVAPAPPPPVAIPTPVGTPDKPVAEVVLDLMDPDEWVSYKDMGLRLAGVGIVDPRFDRTMRDMVDDTRLERRTSAGSAEFRRRLIHIPAVTKKKGGRQPAKVNGVYRPTGGGDRPGLALTRHSERQIVAQKLVLDRGWETRDRLRGAGGAKVDFVLRRCGWFTFGTTGYLFIPNTLDEGWTKARVRPLTDDEIAGLNAALAEDRYWSEWERLVTAEAVHVAL